MEAFAGAMPSPGYDSLRGPFAEGFERCFEIACQWRFQRHFAIIGGMLEGEAAGMQREAVHQRALPRNLPSLYFFLNSESSSFSPP